MALRITVLPEDPKQHGMDMTITCATWKSDFPDLGGLLISWSAMHLHEGGF